jgi:uncharacterized DUF497 family protein
MDFEWDSAKAVANFRKHGVSFEEAVSALKDDFAATASDLEHSVTEFRFITLGISAHGRLLAVSHTERGSSIRIISARLATRTERKIYEEN